MLYENIRHEYTRNQFRCNGNSEKKKNAFKHAEKDVFYENIIVSL